MGMKLIGHLYLSTALGSATNSIWLGDWASDLAGWASSLAGWASSLAGWASGLVGWPRGVTYGQMDVRKISAFYRTLSPIGAAAQKTTVYPPIPLF